jgi:hypothetical protein
MAAFQLIPISLLITFLGDHFLSRVAASIVLKSYDKIFLRKAKSSTFSGSTTFSEFEMIIYRNYM